MWNSDQTYIAHELSDCFYSCSHTVHINGDSNYIKIQHGSNVPLIEIGHLVGTLINNCVKFLAAGTLSFSDRLQSLAAKIQVVWCLDRNEQHCFLLPLILIKKDTND